MKIILDAGVASFDMQAKDIDTRIGVKLEREGYHIVLTYPSGDRYYFDKQEFFQAAHILANAQEE